MTEKKTFKQDGREFEIKDEKFGDEFHMSIFDDNRVVIKYSVSVETVINSKNKNIVFGSPLEK